MRQEFVQEVKNLITNNINTIHTVFPGEIVSFDTSTGLAVILPTMKYKKPNGETIDYPQVTGVPVVFPQSYNQQATIAYPIKAGDGCLVLAAEESIDYWMYGQETNTDLHYDMTNSIAIVGLFNTVNAVLTEACNENAVIVDVNGTRIKVTDGRVQIDAAEVEINGDVTINGSLTTQGGTVNLN